jgi:SAM-dependent methyltransferase
MQEIESEIGKLAVRARVEGAPLPSSERGQTLLELRQRRRGELLGAYFDALADQWDSYRGRNAYFHRTQRALFRTYVPDGLSVLEMGCSTGDLLALVRPERGLGIDLSRRMVAKARQKYPDLEFQEGDAVFFDTDARFDRIIINDLLEYVDDIQGLFENCRRLLTARGRILISKSNPLWSWVLRAGAKLGLRTPDSECHFVAGGDAANLLELSGFDVVKFTRRTILPKNIPVVAPLVNMVVALVPLLRRLCVTEFLVARPLAPAREYSVSVVVPCYDEADNIEACVRRVPRMGRRTEVIVVDDGSRDGTALRVKPGLNPGVDVRCISYQPNRGKLHALRTGFAAASGEILMMLDADMTVPPEDLPHFYGPMRDGLADYVNGTRLVYPMAPGSMKLQNFFGNKMFAVLMSWLTGNRLSDTLCGTKVFFKEDYHHFSMGHDPWGDFDLLFGAAQNASKFLEVPIHYEERRAGVSKMKALRHTLALLRACALGFRRVTYPTSWLGKANGNPHTRSSRAPAAAGSPITQERLRPEQSGG